MNRPFDINTHLPCGDHDLDGRLHEERTMEPSDMLRCFKAHRPVLEAHTSGNNVMLFNTTLTPEKTEQVIQGIRTIRPQTRFTTLLDFRDETAASRLVGLRDAGIDGVKFHAYVQEITHSEFSSVTNLCILAQDLGLSVFLDTSYGSAGLYRYDNLRLASHILNLIQDVPVVLLHSGGARIFDAFLLADACPNVFLETSFTLDFYVGSTIEQDLAFCYWKLGPGRVAFGTDAPYVDAGTALRTFEDFLDRHRFTEDYRVAMRWGTAERIFAR